MISTAGLTLADGMDLAGISWDELWFRYLAIGGAGSTADLHDSVAAAVAVSVHEHDVIAQALNEHFLDLHQDHPVAYWRPVRKPPVADPVD